MSIVNELFRDLRTGTSHSVRYLCSEKVDETLSVRGIRIRKLFAPILRAIYATQTEYKLVVDSRAPLPHRKEGFIFALNHRQADDIVLGANAVGRSAYILFGNPTLVLETSNGLGLWAYGMILLYRDRPSSRRASYEKMKYVLEHGGNIIAYPEGYWNLDDDGEADEVHEADCHNSETRLMQDINIGILRLSRETGCAIVPTVLHYDEFERKRCFAIRGNPFFVQPDDDLFSKKDELVDIMQTMLYTLMEKHSAYDRRLLESTNGSLSDQWAKLKEQLRCDCDIPRIGYHLNLQDEKRIGKAKIGKPVTSSKSVFSHLYDLTPSKETAFLFDKRAHF